MTEATPAAAPAAPAADPVADPAAPAAPAAAAPAPAAEPVVQSALDGAPDAPAAAPAAPVAPKADPNAPQPVAPAEWFLSEGVKGSGEPPAWYKADKYKSVAAQAEAYGHLEKRLGAFTGAPKDGKYDFKLPEGVQGEFDTEHPMYKQLVKSAAEMQISNEGFNNLMGMFAQYEASLVPDPVQNLKEAKTELGADADARLSAAKLWAQANLSPELYNEFRAATNVNELSGPQVARVVKVIEGVLAKGRVTMPKPGDDVPGQQDNEQQALQLMLNERNEKGQLKYFEDPKHREKIDKKRNEIMRANPAV